MKAAALALALGFAACASAMDFTLPDGTVLKDVKVSSTTASRASLTHSEGLASVDLGSLTEAQRDQLGVAYDREAYFAAKDSQEREKAEAATEQMLSARSRPLTIRIKQIVEGGALCTAWVGTATSAQEHFGEVFLAGDFEGKVDGDLWQGRAWKVGTFSFTTVMGAQRTIPRWTTLREEALAAKDSIPVAPTPIPTPVVRQTGVPPKKGN
jgi:hypothetical protein